jgi:hypothetical protein
MLASKFLRSQLPIRLTVEKLLHSFESGESLVAKELSGPLNSNHAPELEAVSRKDVASSLVAAGYYGVWEAEDYEFLLSYLKRTDVGKNVTIDEIIELKRFELMIRCGLIPSLTFGDFSNYTKKYLLHIRSHDMKEASISDIDKELSEVLTSIASESVPLTRLGPYVVSFGRLLEPGVRETKKMTSSLRSPDFKRHACVASLEGHRNSPLNRIKKASLERLGLNLAVVASEDWERLSNEQAKKLFLYSVCQSVSKV